MANAATIDANIAAERKGPNAMERKVELDSKTASLAAKRAATNASNATPRVQVMKEISANQKWSEAPKFGNGFVIVGAKPWRLHLDNLAVGQIQRDLQRGRSCPDGILLLRTRATANLYFSGFPEIGRTCHLSRAKLGPPPQPYRGFEFLSLRQALFRTGSPAAANAAQRR
jgi:hypothetical protein